ncbi:MAG: ATP-binding protein [Desulfurococcaceae archaeon]
MGEILNTVPKQVAKITRDALFRHILIVGTTGAGKSYTAATISKRIVKVLSIPVLIVDWHNEYTKLLENFEEIDPYETPIPLFTGDVYDIDIISNILELTPPQEYLLEKIVRKIDISKLDLDKLLDIIENYPEESNWMRESKLALHRKLSVICRRGFNALFTNYGKANKDLSLLSKTFHGPYIVNVNKIVDIDVRKLYTAFLVKKISNDVINTRGKLIIVLEEASNYLSRQHPVKLFSDMLREVRKFDIGLTIISQSPSQLIEDALINTNTKIIHALKSKQDLELIEKTLYLDHELLSTIPYLEPGEAVYSTTCLKKPVLVKIS